MDWTSSKNITPADLLKMARSKYLSAQTLLENAGYEFEGEFYEGNENAVYLAGYSLELILKRHIALKLGWNEYPPKHYGPSIDGYKEEKDDKSFIIHDLNRLLILTGLYNDVQSDIELKSHWDTVLRWQAGMRYCSPDLLTLMTAKETLDSIKYMIRWIITKT